MHKHSSFLYKFFVLFILSSIISITSVSANDKYAAVVIHEKSGEILYSRYIDKSLHPASLTKLMTLYLVFEALEEGKISKNTLFKVSARAANQPPSKLGVKKGSKINVDTAIKSLVIKSANDVSVVVAENLAANEFQFVKKMNEKAKDLGLYNTTFQNPHGLSHKYLKSTAYDLALLAQRIIQDFPQYYYYFSLRTFYFKGRKIYSHNHVLKSFKGAEGLKTGYTRLSGYNLITSATVNGERLIGVVLGGRTSKTRDSHMRYILRNSFARLNSKKRKFDYAYLFPQEPVIKNESKIQLAGNIYKDEIALKIDKNSSTRNANLAFNSDDIIDQSQNEIEENDNITNMISENSNYELANNDYFHDETIIGEGDYDIVENKEDWYVQVGAFSDIRKANKELSKSIQISNVTKSYVNAYIDSEKNKTLYRPRIVVSSLDEGNNICAKLIEYQISCFVKKK